jgi:hypothetical protein
MEGLKKLELTNSHYRCSLCKTEFKSLGKMQDHMLKAHLLNLKNLQVSRQ